MIFTREFYAAHRPTFRLTESEMASSEYQRYLASCPHRHDSGVGYGFKVWSQGLSWFPLKPVDRDREPDSTGALYGNLIFHLGGAIRNRTAGEDASPSKTRTIARLLSLCRAFGKAIMPSKLWRRINRMDAVQRWAGAHWARPLRVKEFQETRTALLADPEKFLHGLMDAPPGEAEVAKDF